MRKAGPAAYLLLAAIAFTASCDDKPIVTADDSCLFPIGIRAPKPVLSVGESMTLTAVRDDYCAAHLYKGPFGWRIDGLPIVDLWITNDSTVRVSGSQPGTTRVSLIGAARNEPTGVLTSMKIVVQQ